MKLHRFVLPILAAASLACAAQAALAQDADEGLRDRLKRIEKQLGEVRSIVFQAKATGHPVEVKEAGPDPQVVELQSRFDDLAQSLRLMTGQVETLTHDLDQTRKDGAAQTAALAARLDKLEKQMASLAAPPQPAPPPSATAPQDARPPAGGQAADQDPKDAYARARKVLLDGDYPAASAAFQDYIDRFGDTAAAPSARYWLGETKYIQNDYSGAATAFIAAIRGWPKTSWAPEAVIKLSLSLTALNKTDDACKTLGELRRRYVKLTAVERNHAREAGAKASCGG